MKPKKATITITKKPKLTMTLKKRDFMKPTNRGTRMA